MKTLLEKDVTQLDRAGLMQVWFELHERRAPRSISMQLLRRIIAYEQQLRTYGDLSTSIKRRLDKLSNADVKVDTRMFAANTRLIREWNGVTHIVDVTDDGFLWRGKSYRSLSAIARAITGVRWSGPRFFGTKKGAVNAGN